MSLMSTLNELQQQSLQQYNTFYKLTLAVENSLLPLNTEKINQLSRELDQIKEKVRKTDIRLNAFLQQNTQAAESQLNAERLALMQKIIDKNTTLSPKIQAMMAMQASELSKIKQGRNTLGGYTSQASKAGRIINTAN